MHSIICHLGLFSAVDMDDDGRLSLEEIINVVQGEGLTDDDPEGFNIMVSKMHAN